MKSIVSYKERGIGGNSKYRGNCSPKLIEDLIKQFGIKDISDYMRGSNTTGQVAQRFNIKSNTYDLNCGFDLLNNDIKERNQFIFWHPPYWDIVKYSGNMYGNKALPTDLSQIRDYDKFVELMNYCMIKQFHSLENKGRMAVLLGDIKKQGKLYSMILDIIKPGTIENIVIKAQHNCWSDNVIYQGNFIPIVHEYLLILKKDNPLMHTVRLEREYKLDIRDSKVATWKDLVASILEYCNGKATLQMIYKLVEGHKKTSSNSNWKEKIRQTLQIYTDIFKRVDRGVWELR